MKLFTTLALIAIVSASFTAAHATDADLSAKCLTIVKTQLTKKLSTTYPNIKVAVTKVGSGSHIKVSNASANSKDLCNEITHNIHGIAQLVRIDTKSLTCITNYVGGLDVNHGTCASTTNSTTVKYKKF